MIAKYARGMVYWVNLPNAYGDSVQTGRRPCIIVSNNVGNIFSENLTIVPCTTNLEKSDSQPTHYKTKLYATTESVVLCENINTVNKKLVEGFIGLLDETEMEAIDKCIAIAIGLQEIPKNQELPEMPRDASVSEEEINVGRVVSLEAKKEFLLDFAKHGVDYVVRKYQVASPGAAYQRRKYYQKQLTKKK